MVAVTTVAMATDPTHPLGRAARRPGLTLATGLATGLATALGLLACARSPEPASGGPSSAAPSGPRVLATVTMLADGAAALLGESGRVDVLIGPGVDPHLYRPTRDDMGRLLEADLVLAVGLHLEANLEGSLERLAADAQGPARLWQLGAALEPAALLGTPVGDQGLESHDPHVWMDLPLWSQGIGSLASELGRRWPGQAASIDARAAAYRAELERLDGYLAACIASIPPERRVLVTAHDAFRYFGRRYGLDVRGLQGLSTESEAGLKELAELVERRIPAVFVESSVPEQGVRALIAGAAERGFEVALGGVLYSDATGPAGSPAGTLVGMLASNAETIARGLGGQPPAGGFPAWASAGASASGASAAPSALQAASSGQEKHP